MWQVIGHNRAVSLLQRSLEKGTTTHAYLFVGPPHAGKMTLAMNLAQALNCEAGQMPCGQCASCRKIARGKHADVRVIDLTSNSENGEDKNRTEIGIEQIRQLQHSASLPPFEGRNKIFIIDGAEMLSVEAANCLLKTLEEPVAGVVFVLLAADTALLPETVVSRCQCLELKPMPVDEAEAALAGLQGIEPQPAKLLSRLCHGCIGWAIEAAGNDELLNQYRENRDSILDIISAGFNERFDYASRLAVQFSQKREYVRQILNLWLDLWRDLLLIKAGSAEAITNIDIEIKMKELAGEYSLADIRRFIGSLQAARQQLWRNASPRLVLEVLMLDISQKRKEGVLK
jgi:DNA polymerase-3 subunit delta'